MEEKILSWLKKEGYPLELMATQILRKIGFEVGQSIYYQDPETNSSREIDLVAYKYFKVNDTWVTFSFVIECKSSRDKPWLAFTSKEERLYPNDLIIHRNANKKGKSFLKDVANDDFIKGLDLFKLPENTSYNLIRALSDGIDVTYKALMSVTNATQSLSSNSNESGSPHRFYFPIILIDSKLFDCHLDKDLEIVLSEIPNTKLVMSNAFLAQRANFIDLFTLDCFERKMSQYYTDIETIVEFYKDKFRKN